MAANETGDDDSLATFNQSSSSADLVNDIYVVYDNIKRGVAKKTDGVRRAIYRSTDATHRAFQAITSNDKVVQFRIDVDGRLIFDKTLRRFDSHRRRAAKSVRRVITGDPEKPISDHLRETPQVKMMDKVSFTMGVVVIALTEYIILRIPSVFEMYYASLLLALFAVRFYLYTRSKYHLFMLDFCYLVNISCVAQTVFYPGHRTWFLSNYTLVMGPLCLGTVMWNNSLVFHSIDKLTSFFIHIFPPILYHLRRWSIIERTDDGGAEILGDLSAVSLSDIFMPSLVIYIVWQISYLVSTEILLGTKLAADPELMTSLRYMVKDKRNVVAVAVTDMLKKRGWLTQDHADPESFLAKCILVTLQLIYTVSLIVPTIVLFHSYHLSSVYLLCICLFATWNGASYYIEIFSKRYNLQFETDDSSEKAATVLDETRGLPSTCSSTDDVLTEDVVEDTSIDVGEQSVVETDAMTETMASDSLQIDETTVVDKKFSDSATENPLPTSLSLDDDQAYDLLQYLTRLEEAGK